MFDRNALIGFTGLLGRGTTGCPLCVAEYRSFSLIFSFILVFFSSSRSLVCAAATGYFPGSSTCSFFLCHLCLASSRSYIVFFVLDFIVLISWVAFSLCYRSPYVRILLVCFDSFATLGDLAVTVSDSGICVSMMKNHDGLWGCC